jgi:hypothetical protein
MKINLIKILILTLFTSFIILCGLYIEYIFLFAVFGSKFYVTLIMLLTLSFAIIKGIEAINK